MGTPVEHLAIVGLQENLHRLLERKSAWSEAIAVRIFYLAFAIWFFAAATTFSGVKPYFFCSSFNGAEAPNVSIPML